MRHSVVMMLFGLFLGGLFTSVLAVFLFHDADVQKIGRTAEAFAGLAGESALFAIGVGVAAQGLAALWQLSVGPLRGVRSRSPFTIGLGVAILQYPFEWGLRKAFPGLGDTFLWAYLGIAVAGCTFALLAAKQQNGTV